MSSEIEELPTYGRTRLEAGRYVFKVRVGEPAHLFAVRSERERRGRNGRAEAGWAVIHDGTELDRFPTLARATEYVETWIRARRAASHHETARRIAEAAGAESFDAGSYANHSGKPCEDTRPPGASGNAHGDANVVVQFAGGRKVRLCLPHAELPAAPPVAPEPPAVTPSEFANAAGAALDRALRPAAAPGPLAPYVDAVERAVEDLRAHAAAVPPRTTPITEPEFEARIAEHPIENLFALDNLLVDRIVKRAKYDALREMLRTVNGWYEGAAENHVALDHHDDGDRCLLFTIEDLQRMVNDTARACGTREPWNPGAPGAVS
jgi:hypothetical protein